MRRYKHIFATGLMFIMLGAVLILSAIQYYAIERNSCFDDLTRYTEQIKNEIIDMSQENQRYLEEIASVIEKANINDIDEMNEILASVGKPLTMIRMELLYEDNHLLTNGEMIDASETLSYSNIIQNKETISKRMNDILDSNKKIIRYYLPITQNNQTVILCGIIDLQQVIQQFTIYGYLENMEFFVVEASSFNFILDTWRESLINFKDLGYKETKNEYDWNQVITDISEEKIGRTIYLSTYANDYFYCYYQPVGILDWMVMITIPESIAFARVNKILHMFYVQAAILFVVFVSYLLWLANDIRIDRKQKREQLDRTKFLLAVEKELSKAHLDFNRFKVALQILADYYSASKAFIYLVDAKSVQLPHFIGNAGNCLNEENSDVLYIVQKLFNSLKEKGELVSDDCTSVEEFSALKQHINFTIENMILIPVDGIDKKLSFIIGVFNMDEFSGNSEALKQVSLSFAITLNHYNSYQTLEKISRIDKLTGLNNRNSFNETLENLNVNETTSLACIYIDANGLHEINNKLGHNAGDNMLQSVANELLNIFAYDLVFRIGGDEFIVLCENNDETVINQKIRDVKMNLKAHNYEISYGISWVKNDNDIQEIVNRAESVMRMNKQLYYQSKESERHVRLLNEQVEKMVADKNDADAFLEAVASEFKGVYFVNLNRDTIRHLFIPSYFEVLLEETQDKFSQAMVLYAQRIVAKEYQEQVKQFSNYEYLITLFEQGITPECIYQKVNGDWINLSVIKFKDYSDDHQETIWIFKTMDEDKKV